MLSKVIIKCNDITKIKKFENAVVVYTKNNYFVCEKNQNLPKINDLFIELNLKKRGDK